MPWFLLVLLAVSALAPLIGTDTRDSRDWRDEEPPEARRRTPLRTSDSPVPVPSVPVRAGVRRPTSATC